MLYYSPAKMCRNGTRENCPVNKCRFQHSMPAHVIYSSALKGAVPPPPSPVTSPTRSHFPSTAQGIRGWCDDGKVHAQHICPSVENAVLTQGPRDLNGTPPGPFDANALAQGSYFSPRVQFCGQWLMLSQRRTDSRSIARGSKVKSRCRRPRSRP